MEFMYLVVECGHCGKEVEQELVKAGFEYQWDCVECGGFNTTDNEAVGAMCAWD